MIDTFRLSEKEKLQLIQLKKKTGVEHWNVLCRWAFCLSLKEPSVPPMENLPADSNVEMTWKTFAGEYADIYLALFRHRINTDFGCERLYSDLDLFRLYLSRGISYLNNQKADLLIAI